MKPRAWRHPGLLVHATLVSALSALLLVLVWIHPDDPPDANIGAGLVGLLLMAAEVPWSGLAWNAMISEQVWAVILVGAAAGNVVIHWIVRVAVNGSGAWRAERRAGRRSGRDKLHGPG